MHSEVGLNVTLFITVMSNATIQHIVCLVYHHLSFSIHVRVTSLPVLGFIHIWVSFGLCMVSIIYI